MSGSSAFKIVISFVTLASVGLCIYLYFQKTEIVYVRSYDLIEKYQGTIEARTDFEKRKASMMSNVDSLHVDFERAKNQYLSAASKLSTAQRMEQEKILGQRQNQLIQYGQAIEQKVQEEDAHMMQEVLNQINSFVEDYAKERGFDLVVGTTLSGSLLYGDKSLDVTDDLLSKMNEKYKGK